jgi:hypothetical protein
VPQRAKGNTINSQRSTKSFCQPTAPFLRSNDCAVT